MKISKLIEVLAQYLQERGDMDILVEKYDGITDDSVLEELEELDINVDGKSLVIDGIYNLPEKSKLNNE
jgi:DNA-directed RNA polymerase beta subunit